LVLPVLSGLLASVLGNNRWPVLLLWNATVLTWTDATATCRQPSSSFDAATSVLTVSVCHFTQVGNALTCSLLHEHMHALT
jgi:hypothetical protein